MYGNEHEVIEPKRPVRMFPAFQSYNRKTVVHEDVPDWSDDEQNGCDAIEGILDLSPAWQCFKFINSEQFNITNVAVFPQNAVVAMVEVMALGPVAVWNKTQITTDLTDYVVCFPGCGERLVTTVVLDDKNAHQEKGIDQYQRQHQPIGYVDQEIHRDPDGDKRTEGCNYLSYGFSSIRKLIRLYDGGQLL